MGGLERGVLTDVCGCMNGWLSELHVSKIIYRRRSICWVIQRHQAVVNVSLIFLAKVHCQFQDIVHARCESGLASVLVYTLVIR